MSPFWILLGDGSGGDNWSYKMCKAPVKSLLSTLNKPTHCSLQADALPVARTTVSEH